MPPLRELPKRLVSLDAFRGFTIIGMLWVNNPGWNEALHRQFRHAAWGEFPTFTDMIFPWFLFIVGVALPFSAAAFWQRIPGAGFPRYLAKLVKRAIVLIFLGILIDSSIAKRIAVHMNVLQLIGLAFLGGALLYETPRRLRYAVAAGLLVFYWILNRFVPVPGVGEAVFTQDAYLIKWINDQLRPWHLAGILSVIPTAALVVIGTWFGDMLRDETKPPAAKLKTLLAGGAFLAVAGLLWHLDLEMSKFVWSPSYILFSAGLGAIVLAGFFFLIDMRGWQAWAFPFVVYGMNAIAAYFISIIVRVHTVQEWTMMWQDERITIWRAMLLWWTDLLGRSWGSYCFTGSYIVFWFFILWWMYRRRIFWRV